jgi:hypothetical protein
MKMKIVARKKVSKEAAISMDQAAININIKLKECLQLFEKIKIDSPDLKEKLKLYLFNSEKLSAKLVG